MPLFSPSIIHVKRSFPVNVKRLWKSWTEEQEINAFFAQDSHIELAIGGAYEVYFSTDVAEGKRGSENCKVLSYLPYQMLSFSWVAPPNQPVQRAMGAVTWVVLLFAPAADMKGSVLDLYHLGWDKQPNMQHTFAYFEKAWPSVLASLANYYSTI